MTGSISPEVAAVAAAGNIDLLAAQLRETLDTIEALKAEASRLVLLRQLGLEPPDAERRMAAIAARTTRERQRLAATLAALQQPTRSLS